jgi:hypothetical protein
MRARFLLPVVLAALLAGCGGAGDAARTITFAVDPLHGSGIDGIAELTRIGPGTARLHVDLDGAPPPGVTVAVYRGSCVTLPTLAVSERVEPNGDALTVRVERPLRSLARDDHAVVLRRNGYVLGCGDIPPGVPSSS